MEYMNVIIKVDYIPFHSVSILIMFVGLWMYISHTTIQITV